MLPWYLCIAISKIAVMETLKALNHEHFLLLHLEKDEELLKDFIAEVFSTYFLTGLWLGCCCLPRDDQ